MRYFETEKYHQMSRKAANIISAQIITEPDSVLGLATGSTPLGIYRQLIEWYKKGDLDFSQITTVNLDEYIGLSGDNEQSYRYYMNNNFFKHVNIDMNRTFVPSGIAADIKAECDEFDARIRRLGGIDLQLLGIGEDGHIGFNEPAAHFTTNSYCVKLSEQTLHDNRRFFDKNAVMPTHALTMGIASIMQAQHIVLVATGLGKADAVRRMIEGPVDPMVPASILQMHRHATILLDADAASQLKK